MVLMLCWLAFAGTEDVADRYRAHVQFLADDLLEGRETSFRGQQLASRYLATQLALAGAEPVYPDRENPYYQPFKVRVSGTDPESLRIRLKDRGEPVSFKKDQDFSLRIIGSGDFDFSAPMVFVGYGLSEEGFDEYQGVKVEGRWVVMLEGQPEGDEDSIFGKPLAGARTFRKVMKARNEGAKGIVMLNKGALKARSGVGPGHRFRLVDAEESSRAPRLLLPILTVPEDSWPKLFGKDFEKFQKRTALITESQEPQSFQIRKRELSISANTKKEIRETENVVAILPGSDPQLKNEYVVISAHFDHVGIQNGAVYNGADDNASGSATLLMLARDLQNTNHKRSLMLLLVSAEESGLLGSTYFIENPPVPKEQLVANINMDMIGRHKVGEIGVIPSEVKGISTLNQILEEVNKTSPFQHKILKDMDRYHTRSDHYNFTKNDIPAIFFFAGVHDDYHGPDDDWKKLNYEKLERLYGLMKAFTVEILNAPEAPVFLEVEEAGEDGSE